MMDVNSIQGANQYQNPPAAAPADTSALRNQNREASKADLDEKSAAMAQQAFNIDISAEGKQRLAETQGQTPVPENSESRPPGNHMFQNSEASRLVNIVA